MPAPRRANRALALSVSVAIVLAAGRDSAVSAQTASTRAQQPPAKGKATTPARLDLNRATDEEMVEKLPGVGLVTARKIVAGRPYARVDDLAKAGVPERTIEAIRGLVTVGPPATATLIPAPRLQPAMPKGTTSAAKTGDPKSATKAAKPKAATPGRGGLKPGQLVNINTAPREVLDLLPGIGPVKAQAIVEGRPFKTRQDVMKVKGIKQGEFDRIKDLITVD